MKRIDRIKLIRFIVYLILILLLYLAGETPGLIPEIMRARPLLMIPCALSIALTGGGELPAMGFGVLCGLLMDHSRDGPYGFFALILAVLCYFIGLLTKHLFQKNLLSALLMSVLSIAVTVGLNWVFFYLLAGYSEPVTALVRYYLPAAGYTFAVMIPVYAMFRGIAALLRSERRSA